MVDYIDMGKKLRAARKSAHLTQEKVASKAGISAAFLGHIERGSRVASLDTIIELCNTLSLSPDTLLSASLTCDHRSAGQELTTDDRQSLQDFLALAQKTVDAWNK